MSKIYQQVDVVVAQDILSKTGSQKIVAELGALKKKIKDLRNIGGCQTESDLLSKIYQCAEALTVERGCPGKIINGGHEVV